MKIGLLLSYLWSAERYNKMVYAPLELFKNLADELVNRGNEVFVYTTSNVKTKAHLITGNKLFEEKDYPTASDWNKDLPVETSLMKLRTFLEHDVDLTSFAVSHANENGIEFMHAFQSRYFNYFLKFLKMPSVISLHDPPPSDNTIDYLRLMRFKDKNYLSLSQNHKDNYEKIGIKTIRSVPHGLKISDFEFSEGSQNYMAFMGRLIEEKGIIESISLTKRLKIAMKISTGNDQTRSDYYLSSVLPALTGANYSFEGHLDCVGRSAFMKNAKLFLFPIKWEEPFGLVQIEAMACGTPVVAFARGSVPEVIKDGKTGFIVNSSDSDVRGNWIVKKIGIEGLCEAVKKIYSMPEEEYRQMRRACRAHVEKNFTVERMVDQYEEVYKKILSNPPAGEAGTNQY